MVNDNREPRAVALLERLEDAAYSDYFLFGQQNAGHIGNSIKVADGTESDIKTLVGSHPAIVGVDTLSFLGYEGKMEDLINVTKQLDKEGVIITLSSHMPNFSLGKDQYFDYTPNITEGDVGHRIMPGGDLNAKFRGFLDMIAKYADACVDIHGNHIPIIFRPFHEDSGNWFWWGKEHLEDKDFIKLFRYTIDYLRNTKGIKSFLYAYSPNGMFDSKEQYMCRYPGDDYIDVMGMDVYNDRPVNKDSFWDKLKTSLKIVNDCAEDHGKVYALTELGMRTLDAIPGQYYEGLAPKGNKVKNWFTRVIDTMTSSEELLRCAWILTWSNFSEEQFWVPYTKGNYRHEMCDDFVKFAADPHIKLAPAFKTED